jgi:hypothetical protein
MAHERAIIKAEKTSAALRVGVIEALRDGMRPAEVREHSGWSPAQIRAIARGAGIAPAKPGRPASG